MTTRSNTLTDRDTRGGVIRWARLYDKAVGVISMGRESAMRNSSKARS